MAIFFVLAFHYTIRWVLPADNPPHIPAASPFADFIPFEYGWLGVELFFVVSGFVILMTLRRCSGPLDFAYRRFARLWPALLVAATLTTIVVNLFGPPDFKATALDYFASLTLINPLLLGHFGLTAQWIDGAYWSLWVELRFYVLVATVYFLSGRQFLKVWLALQTVAALFALPTHGRLVEAANFLGYLPYFTVGICAFEIWSNRERQLAVAGGIFAAAMVFWDAALAQGLFDGRSGIICAIANLSIFALFALFLVDHPILKPLGSKPMVALGQASYSLYLIHQYIGVTLLRELTSIPYLIALPLVIAVCIATSLALFRWVEAPAKKWLTQQITRERFGVAQGVPGGF